MDKSIENFRKSIKIEPNYLGNYVLVASYWAVKGDKKLFKDELNKVLKMNPLKLKAVGLRIS